MPDWLFLWEHDFDALRDLIYEHISQAVRRYRGYIHSWTVTSGIAADKLLQPDVRPDHRHDADGQHGGPSRKTPRPAR